MQQNKQSLYDAVTSTIVEQLSKDIIPWRKGWNKSQDFMPGFPHNFFTDNMYSGINVISLLMKQIKSEYARSSWATYNQVRAQGGNIRKGEHGTPILFVGTQKPDKKQTNENHESDSTSQREHVFVKRFFVFNIAQCESIEPETDENRPSNKIENALVESYIGSTEARTIFGGNEAFYTPHSDVIALPLVKNFTSTEAFLATYFHELIHWTGHESRLNRTISKTKGSTADAFEELIAEFGATFLMLRFGLNANIENHASYIHHWLKRLRDDNRMVFKAAAAAQKAVEYLDSLQKSDTQFIEPQTHIDNSCTEIQ